MTALTTYKLLVQQEHSKCSTGKRSSSRLQPNFIYLGDHVAILSFSDEMVHAILSSQIDMMINCHCAVKSRFIPMSQVSTQAVQKGPLSLHPRSIYACEQITRLFKSTEVLFNSNATISFPTIPEYRSSAKYLTYTNLTHIQVQVKYQNIEDLLIQTRYLPYTYSIIIAVLTTEAFLNC